MSDRDITKTLTKVGFLWLKYIGCSPIATEVRVVNTNLRDYSDEQDNHNYIDLVGLHERRMPDKKHYEQMVEYISDKNEKFNYVTKVTNEVIMRGIEIKVSRSDFKNGFICSGCDYHYLMVPKGLVSLSEISKGIGFIEVDLDNLKLNKKRRFAYYTDYWFDGIKLTRKPTRKPVQPNGLEYVSKQMAGCLTGQVKLWLQDELGVEIHRNEGA